MRRRLTGREGWLAPALLLVDRCGRCGGKPPFPTWQSAGRANYFLLNIILAEPKVASPVFNICEPIFVRGPSRGGYARKLDGPGNAFRLPLQAETRATLRLSSEFKLQLALSGARR